MLVRVDLEKKFPSKAARYKGPASILHVDGCTKHQGGHITYITEVERGKKAPKRRQRRGSHVSKQEQDVLRKFLRATRSSQRRTTRNKTMRATQPHLRSKYDISLYAGTTEETS
ncbi:hypothetical protein L596_001595 [Steinernema carpocapsae]|uniref:Uncharacterized protein n=1 Tax=Steinernema carpocapsae TaxID=34508 RepID=A0A4U8UPA4_STECR|nr:hypothetical protein L596_001595 [Steinernema carpocapsae]